MILCFGGNDIYKMYLCQRTQNNLKINDTYGKRKKDRCTAYFGTKSNLFGLSPLAIYEEVADEENVPLLTRYVSRYFRKPSLKSDQIHPNASGYKQMAEKIYSAIKDHGWLNSYASPRI